MMEKKRSVLLIILTILANVWAWGGLVAMIFSQTLNEARLTYILSGGGMVILAIGFSIAKSKSFSYRKRWRAEKCTYYFTPRQAIIIGTTLFILGLYLFLRLGFRWVYLLITTDDWSTSNPSGFIFFGAFIIIASIILIQRRRREKRGPPKDKGAV